MTLERIHKVLDEVLGPRLLDNTEEGEPRIDRNFVVDILMDYMYNNKDRQFVVESLKSIIGERMSVLELCAMLEEVDCLREKPDEYSDTGRTDNP
jgi:hypothetical protein